MDGAILVVAATDGPMPQTREPVSYTHLYPEGVADPDYCILKFTAEKGRYYSNFKSEDFDIEEPQPEA